MKQNHINYWAFALLIIPVVLLLVSGLTWCIGASICSFTFPLALVFTLFMANKIISRQKIQYQSIAYCLVYLVAVGALCYFVHDPAFDSNWYHQPGIYLLSHGWNPIYDHHSARVINDTSHIWIDHYAKGQETICATIVAFTGNMEIGKFVQLCIVGWVAAFLIVIYL